MKKYNNKIDVINGASDLMHRMDQDLDFIFKNFEIPDKYSDSEFERKLEETIEEMDRELWEEF